MTANWGERAKKKMNELKKKIGKERRREKEEKRY
jgi:hypothetical protein